MNLSAGTIQDDKLSIMSTKEVKMAVIKVLLFIQLIPDSASALVETERWFEGKWVGQRPNLPKFIFLAKMGLWQSSLHLSYLTW